VTLPRAVASGPSSATPDAVRPVRVAIAAGLLTALYLLALYTAAPVPARVLALLGGATSEIERHGGMEMVWSPPAGMSVEEVVQRFSAGDARVRLRQDGDAFVVGVPGVRRDEIEDLAQWLGGEHGLEFHRVRRVDEMLQLAQLLQLPIDGARPVDLEIDQWRPDSSGITQTDYYLVGTSWQAIEAKLAEAEAKGWQLPQGTRIAWEYLEGERENLWRTYVIDEAVELDGSDIADAFGSYDPNTNRPIVLLDFTPEGARKLGQLTSEIVGEKLATVIGNTVYSAPIINDAIRGGRASITMGGTDPARQQRERDLLVHTLRAGALPKGGTTTSVRYVEPAADGAQRWLARGLIAVGGGAMIALLAWVVIRVTRPVRRALPARIDGPAPWNRLGITLVAPLAVYAVSQITALGIDEEELLYQFGGSWFGAEGVDRFLETLSFGALGVLPVINAFIFVEVLALIVPSWRRRRHAGTEARTPINAAVVITAAMLLFVQGWFITQYLYSLGDVLPFGVGPRMLVIGSFAVGTLVLTGVAALIRTHGLGNGYGALIAGGWLVGVSRVVLDGPIDRGELLVGGATILAIAIPLVAAARWRIARLGEAPLRVPTSGIAPLGEAGGLAILVAMLMKFPLEDVTLKLYEWTLAARTHQWILIALVVVLTIVWSYAFARPKLTQTLAERVGLVGAARPTWWAATLLTIALLLLVGAAMTLTTAERPSRLVAVDVLTIAMVAMVLLDLVDDWRARRVVLDLVWSLQQPQHADLVSRALDDAGIPHHLSSANLRSLLAFFGPFAPIDVLVPPEHAPAAREKLRELFE
jgi:hypothetical protein